MKFPLFKKIALKIESEREHTENLGNQSYIRIKE